MAISNCTDLSVLTHPLALLLHVSEFSNVRYMKRKNMLFNFHSYNALHRSLTQLNLVVSSPFSHLFLFCRLHTLFRNVQVLYFILQHSTIELTPEKLKQWQPCYKNFTQCMEPTLGAFPQNSYGRKFHSNRVN